MKRKMHIDLAVKSPIREDEGYRYMYMHYSFMTSALYFLLFLLFNKKNERRRRCVTNIFDKQT